MTVTPTAYTDVGTYYFVLTTTTASGNVATSRELTYFAAIVHITCTVVSITQPVDPTTNLEYIVYDSNLFIDLYQRGITYEQVPDCQHPMQNSFTWTIPGGSPISQVADMSITVGTDDKTFAASSPYSVSMVNTITFDGSLVPTNSGSSFPITTGFDVTVVDPCETGVVNSVAINTMTILNGESDSQTFIEATVSVEIANQGLFLCGPRDYLIVEDSSGTDTGVSWLPITGNRLTNFVITGSPDDDSLVTGGSQQYYLKSWLVDYPSQTRYDVLSVTVSAANCDC